MVKAAGFTGFAIAVALQFYVTTRLTKCGKPWVFFDLGNTVVASKPGAESEYISGAHEYVKQLKRRGYRIGLISNVPQNWGATTEEKVKALKKMIAESWTKNPNADPMDWSDFSDALLFVPNRAEYRKPAPYLFRSALSQVSLEEGETRCRVVFQGEDPKEVEAAKKEGMVGYLVNQDGQAPFLPLEQLDRLTH